MTELFHKTECYWFANFVNIKPLSHRFSAILPRFKNIINTKNLKVFRDPYMNKSFLVNRRSSLAL